MTKFGLVSRPPSLCAILALVDDSIPSSAAEFDRDRLPIGKISESGLAAASGSAGVWTARDVEEEWNRRVEKKERIVLTDFTETPRRRAEWKDDGWLEDGLECVGFVKIDREARPEPCIWLWQIEKVPAVV